MTNKVIIALSIISIANTINSQTCDKNKNCDQLETDEFDECR